MKKFFLHITVVVASVVGLLALPILTTLPVAAQSSPEKALCEGANGVWNDKEGSCNQAGNSRTVIGTIRQVTTVLTFLVGAVSVIMLIIGGFKYVTSQGDQSAISSAKNTIMYALVGVVVAGMAYAIVNWLLSAFGIG